MITDKKYLNDQDIKEYIELSKESKKIVVVTDIMGSGKSRSMLDYVAKNYEKDLPRIVVEKISTCREIKKQLIEDYKIPEHLVGAYHSDKDSDSLNALALKETKPIAIVTHMRTVIDNLTNWLAVDVITNVRTDLVIIDEIPHNIVEPIIINEGQFFSITGRMENEISKALLKVLDGKKFSSKEAGKILIHSQNKIRQFTDSIIKRKYSLEKIGISYPRLSSNVNNLPQVETLYKHKKDIEVAKQVISNRLLYRIGLIYFAFLTGRFKRVTDYDEFLAIDSCVISSPLYAWNALGRVSTIILDATGDYNFYPKDLCLVAETKIKIKPKKIHLYKCYPEVTDTYADKRNWTKKNDTKEIIESKYKKYYDLIFNLFEQVVDKNSIIYTCTWKDRVVEKEIEDNIGTQTTQISSLIVDDQEDLSYRDPIPIYQSEVLRKWKVSSRPRLNRKFGPGIINLESIIYTIANKFNLYTNIDKINDLEKSNLDPLSKEYYGLSQKLETMIKIYISHFGMNRGENRYSHCNKCIIIGDYYLPLSVYNSYELFLKEKLTEEYIIRKVAGETIQEIGRLRNMYTIEGQEKHIYLISNSKIFEVVKNYFDPKTLEEINFQKIEIPLSSDLYEEFNNLTRNQKNGLLKIARIYPNILKRKPVQLTTLEISNIISIRTDHVIRFLNRISKKMSLEYKIVKKEVTKSQLIEILIK